MGKRYRSYGDEPLVASGDDTINGENGWDHIFGGDGDDTLSGGLEWRDMAGYSGIRL